MKILKKLWNNWMLVAKPIGNFQSQLILTLFYLIIILPLGIIYRLFADPLNIKSDKISIQKTNFRKWEHLRQCLEEAKKQY